MLDVCATGLGYILASVKEGGTETPLFFGVGVNHHPRRTNCFATALEHAELEIVTDHVSLTYTKNLRFGPSNLNQFKFRVTQLAGHQNSAADSISRTTYLQTDPLTARGAPISGRYSHETTIRLCNS